MSTILRDFPWRVRAAMLVLAAAVVGAVGALAPQVFAIPEQLAGDFSWKLAAASRAERRVVVVDIDEASLRDIGPWPWPRATVAQLSDRLAQAGALVQAYDINFSDARQDDHELRRAWTRQPIVAAQIFSLEATATPQVGVVAGAVATAGCPAFAPRSHGSYGTADEILLANPALGHITPRLERDGVVRKLPALVCHEGRAYPSLALSALWRAAQGTVPGAANVAPDWEWHTASGFRLASALESPAWLTSRSLPSLRVPLDEEGNLRVPYRVDRKALASVSAADVLRGQGDRSVLSGAIVLIGATAFGIGDTVATPQAAVASGVEVHAQVLAGLLDNHIPLTPIAAPLGQVAVMGLIAMCLLLLVKPHRGGAARRLPITGVLLAVSCWLLAALGLVAADLWLPWAAAAMFAVLASAALATAEHAMSRAQRERLSAHLGAYLPAPVAERLAGSDPTGSILVEQRDVSVLVADIRNFSAFAAHRPAQETAALLHAFCCLTVDVVEQHGGLVENVVGDSVMAVWNAYSECADHPRQAMTAAQELLRVTRSLLERGVPNVENSPIQPLALGVGVESGSAIVGSFGPTRRRAHAALGEPVSVAARIQKMTLDLSMPILAGPEMASRLPAQSTELLGEYLLEGLSKHYTLYAPAAWAELVPTDSTWMAGATANNADKATEPAPWSRWVHGTAPGANERGASYSLRDA
jgi:adenylate cyclase